MANALERRADPATFYLEEAVPFAASGESNSLVGKAMEGSLGA